MRWVFVIVVLFASVQTHADGRFYGELHVGANGVRHSDLDFYPAFGGVSAGVMLRQGIALEGFVDQSVLVGSKNGFEAEVTGASGVALRLHSPGLDGTRAYVSMGYVSFNIEQQESDNANARIVKQHFTGARFDVGVQQRLQNHPQWLVALGYRNYYSDSGVTVDGLSLGLRFDFQ